jgi:hypothetical protein
MRLLQLDILCDKDEREPDEIAAALQLKELGIDKTPDGKVVQEWRQGLIVVDKIEAYYPHGKHPEFTLMHMTSGAVITVQQSRDTITALLEKLNQNQDGKRVHNYTATIS